MDVDEFIKAREENRIRLCTECKFFFNPQTMYDERSTYNKCIKCRTMHQLKMKRLEWERAEARRKEAKYLSDWEAGE